MEERIRGFSLRHKLHAVSKTKFVCLCCLLILLGCVSPATAQDSPGRYEVGGNLTVTHFPHEFLNSTKAHLGPGLEGDFNFGRHFALDATLNWLPDTTVGVRNNVTQGLFGAKVGTRTQHFGFFGKIRPGFVSLRNSLQLTDVVTANSVTEIFRFSRLTERALDFGGVFEYYPAKHWALRYDAGDTVIFEEGRAVFVNPSLPGPQTVSPPAQHHFQMSTGVHYRF